MEVIIITGACGVGKSTVAKEWAKLKNGAMIERVDIVNKELREYDWPEYVQIVDSTKLSVVETIKEIEILN